MGALEPLIAIAWCVTQTCVLVSSLYLLTPAHVRRLPRDHSTHIQFRALAMLATLVFSLLGTQWLLRDMFWELSSGLYDLGTFEPLVHYVVLFLGPISALGLLPQVSSVNLSFDFWIDFRNLLWAPFVEEVVFRFCMASTFLAVRQDSQFSRPFVVFIPPLLFGTAHVHHWIAAVWSGDMPIKQAVLSMLFQVTYTTLFGGLMMDCLLKTRNWLVVCMIHSWCNLMGFPNVSAMFDSELALTARGATATLYLIGIVGYWKLAW